MSIVNRALVIPHQKPNRGLLRDPCAANLQGIDGTNDRGKEDLLLPCSTHRRDMEMRVAARWENFHGMNL